MNERTRTVAVVVAVGALSWSCGSNSPEGTVADTGTTDDGATDGTVDTATDVLPETPTDVADAPRDADAGAGCKAIWTGTTDVFAIAVDATSVYWTSALGKAVMRVPRSGGAATTLATPEEPSGLAVDSSQAYFAGRGAAVSKVPLAGGTPTLLGAPTCDDAGPCGGPYAPLVIDATHAYFADVAAGSFGGAVYKVPLAGGTVTLLAALTSADAGPPSPAYNLARDATSIYYPNGAGVWKIPIAGGTPTNLAPGNPAQIVTIDATNAYSAMLSDGQIRTVPIAGGASTALYSGAGANSLVVKGSNLYWTTSTGAVMTGPAAGGTATTITSGPPAVGVSAIAVEDGVIYWATAVKSPTGGKPTISICEFVGAVGK